jgi:hypothetical protein
MNYAVPESQRDSILQPRVGEPASLPWETRFIFRQPQRGCIKSASARYNPDGVENHFHSYSQGSSCLATLGWMTLPRWGNQLVEGGQ